jgi:hypothetical protein
LSASREFTRVVALLGGLISPAVRRRRVIVVTLTMIDVNAPMWTGISFRRRLPGIPSRASRSSFLARSGSGGSTGTAWRALAGRAPRRIGSTGFYGQTGLRIDSTTGRLGDRFPCHRVDSSLAGFAVHLVEFFKFDVAIDGSP